MGKSKAEVAAEDAIVDSSTSVMSSKEQRILHQELLEHNDFFDMLVDMIPSKLYIAGQSGDDFNLKITRYYKSPSKNEESKEARKNAAKLAKRRKLDPAVSESTRQVQQRVEQTTTTKTPLPPPPTAQQQQPLHIAPGQSRIEALRAKLHAKIAALATDRPAPETVSKRAARRAEKNRRKTEAVQRAKVQQREKFTTADAVATDNNNNALQRLEFGRLTGFEEHAKSNNYTATNKSLRNLSSGKNLHKLLADAQAKKQKLKDAAAANSNNNNTNTNTNAKSIQWKDALQEASGVRVKDDTTKIKRQIQRKAAAKAKSATAWQARLSQQQAQVQSKQAIRQHNLQQRKKGGTAGANLSRKRIAVAASDTPSSNKRPRRRPGFEGKKQDFLNKKQQQHQPKD